MMGAAILNMISLTVILIGLILVKRWIDDAFEGDRRWRCSRDGLFLYYLLFLLLITLNWVFMLIWIKSSKMFYFSQEEFEWSNKQQDDFFKYFVIILL